jgi:hypothetical protein
MLHNGTAWSLCGCGCADSKLSSGGSIGLGTRHKDNDMVFRSYGSEYAELSVCNDSTLIRILITISGILTIAVENVCHISGKGRGTVSIQCERIHAAATSIFACKRSDKLGISQTAACLPVDSKPQISFQSFDPRDRINFQKPSV